jgi:membrane-associated HD superfamily phosphohydrolase
MSALIILNHVKEGLNLAQKYKLKPPLREVIETHHGTSLVGFFYQRAMELNTDGKERVDENDFRYPGPLPVGKEASIISVADACEAASRSLSEPTPGKIDTLVSDIITNRLLDGQLNDSDLSMSELQTVRESIKKSLRTMLHLRISYNPNLVTNENSPEQKIAPVPTEKSAPVVEGDSPSG